MQHALDSMISWQKNPTHKWIILVRKKHGRIHQRWVDHNSHKHRIFFAAANVKPPKASLDATDVMKLAGEICGGVLVKY